MPQRPHPLLRFQTTLSVLHLPRPSLHPSQQGGVRASHRQQRAAIPRYRHRCPRGLLHAHVRPTNFSPASPPWSLTPIAPSPPKKSHRLPAEIPPTPFRSVAQSPFDPVPLPDGAPASLTVAPGGATLFSYALPPPPSGVPLWELEFLLAASARQLPLSRKDVVLTVAMAAEAALVGLASESDPTGPGRNPGFPAPYVSGMYIGCVPGRHPPCTHRVPTVYPPGTPQGPPEPTVAAARRPLSPR